jgi:tetratricopeptide (TPR) repeat protein
VFCLRIAGQLEKDDDLKPLATQFVLLKIDTGTPVWTKWNARHKCDGDGEPKVFVVRGDGKQLYGSVGAPNAMQSFLKEQLQDAGKILGARELAELEKAVLESQKAFRRKDYAKAIEVATSVSGEGSYASSASALESLLGKLVDRARIALKNAEKKLASKVDVFDGAVGLVEAQRVFGQLPAAREILDPAVARYRDNPKISPLIDQAESVDKARQLEAQRKWKDAKAAYEEFLERYPDSPASESSKKQIKEMARRILVGDTGPGPAKPSAAEPTKGSAGADKATAADEKKAISFLKLGEQLKERNPAKARDYFEKAIKAAPDSATAKEAAKLIKALPAEGTN